MIQVEIEAKFSIPDPQVLDRLLATGMLAGFAVGKPRKLEVIDRYGDTRDWAILGAGYACRVREIAGQRILSLKSFGQAAGAIRRREEREIHLDPGVTDWDVSRWPDGPVKSLVQETISDAPLDTRLILTQTRHMRILSAGARPVAELSLDTVRHPASEPILELEVELLPDGRAAELEQIAAALEEEWGLPPATLSKFERGLEIRRGHGLVVLPRRVKGREPDQDKVRPASADVIRADDPMSEAGRKVLRQHFERMLAHEPGARLGEDIEALHDMRVATRRMRAALRVFGPFFEPKAIKSHLKGLKRTGRALGPVRDLDVFEEKAQQYLAGLPAGRGTELANLRAAWRAERQVARGQMLAYLDGARYARFVQRFDRFLSTPMAGARPAPVGQPTPFRVQHLAPRLLYTRFEAVRAYEPLLESAPLDLLHALRIDLKQLRYTLEFFGPVLGREAGMVIREVEVVQDHLGDLNDADVAVQLLSQFLQRGTEGERGLLAYRRDCEAERTRLLALFPAAWRHLNRPRVSRNLALAIAAL